LSLTHRDGRIEKIIIEKEELTKIASRGDVVGFKLDSGQESRQQQSSPPPEPSKDKIKQQEQK